MRIIGPQLERQLECEAVLRSLPPWFGIEEALGIGFGSVRMASTKSSLADRLTVGRLQAKPAGDALRNT
jgi:hypothetical protein